MRILITLIISLLFFAVSACGGGGGADGGGISGGSLPASTGNVSGTVTENPSTNPINGATVKSRTNTTTTNSVGSYTLSGLSTGNQTVVAEKSGYSTDSQAIMVEAGKTVTCNFSLSKSMQIYQVKLETKHTNGTTINAKLTVNGLLYIQKFDANFQQGSSVTVVLEDPITIGQNQYTPVLGSNDQFMVNSNVSKIYQYEQLPPTPTP